MIDVAVLTTASGDLIGFSLNDHAGYGEENQDIVCAAVSSAAYLVANTVTEILHVDAITTVDETEADMLIRVAPKDAPPCRDLFAGFRLHLQGLEEQYPEYIRVSYLEVQGNA